MSSGWEMEEIPARQEPRAPSGWLLLAVLVAFETVGVLVVFAGWPKGETVWSNAFVYQALYIPLTICTALLGACLYAGYELPADSAWLWNVRRQWRAYYWLNWARGHVAIVDSVVLTPENDLAERLLGLEGAPPVNPDKVLALDLDAPAGSSRMACALESLLSPLLPVLTRLVRLGPLEIVLQTADEGDLKELLRLMRQLGVPDRVSARWTPGSKAACMDTLWGAAPPLAGSRLVLACQLHDGQEAPEISEIAVAVLLAAPQTLAGARPPIRPQGNLCRAITAEADGVEAALAKLVDAGQVPAKRIKQFWYTDLSKGLRHAVTTAVGDSALTVASHDIDRALGRPGPAHAWLAQALAASMIGHGQGAQLVATPCSAGVALNVVGPAPVAAVRPTDYGPLPLSLFWTMGAAGFTALLLCLDLPGKDDARDAVLPVWAYPLIWLGLMAAQVGMSIVHQRQTSTTFDQVDGR